MGERAFRLEHTGSFRTVTFGIDDGDGIMSCGVYSWPVAGLVLTIWFSHGG
jgi:hypothetical protein